MSSPFDDLDLAMQGVIEETFGEDITIIPRGGDFNFPIADPLRPIVSGVRAIVSTGVGLAASDFNNSNRNGAPVVNGSTEVWIDATTAAAIGYAIKRNDLIDSVDATAKVKRFTVSSAIFAENGDLHIYMIG